MKIANFGINVKCGKINLVDPRVDKLKEIFKAVKKTYLQIELIEEAKVVDADLILCLKDKKLDLILQDLDFVDTRLSRTQDQAEKELLSRLKENLEKEEPIFKMQFSDEEKKIIAGYSILTIKPTIFIDQVDALDFDFLDKVYHEAGFIYFFTAGVQDSRSWSIKKGTTAWEAAGVIHSAIQKGFIRAEIIPVSEIIKAGDFNNVRNNIRLEQKDYIVQDGDWVTFRSNA